MKNAYISISSLALFACLASGCVTKTTVKDASRTKVHFASSEAAQTFYDAYLSSTDPQGHGSVVVYFPLPYSHRTVSTDSVRFNSAAQRADGNHDGIISEEEANAFAAQSSVRKLALSSSPK